jgi:hypothetical protein
LLELLSKSVKVESVVKEYAKDERRIVYLVEDLRHEPPPKAICACQNADALPSVVDK